MVRKLLLVVDNGPIRTKVAPTELLEAYFNFCLALWGIHGR